MYCREMILFTFELPFTFDHIFRNSLHAITSKLSESDISDPELFGPIKIKVPAVNIFTQQLL